jgi:hypothetical protein
VSCTADLWDSISLVKNAVIAENKNLRQNQVDQEIKYAAYCRGIHNFGDRSPGEVYLSSNLPKRIFKNLK